MKSKRSLLEGLQIPSMDRIFEIVLLRKKVLSGLQRYYSADVSNRNNRGGRQELGGRWRTMMGMGKELGKEARVLGGGRAAGQHFYWC